MSYEDKFGITPIEQNRVTGRVDTFDISWDVDGEDINDKSIRYPVFLIVPDKKKFDHEHVGLTRKGAQDLRDWLTAYLEDTK